MWIRSTWQIQVTVPKYGQGSRFTKRIVHSATAETCRVSHCGIFKMALNIDVRPHTMTPDILGSILMKTCSK